MALGTLGLAVMAVGPATGWSEEAPGKARVAVLGDADLFAGEDEDGEEAGSVRIYGDDADDEEVGRVSVRGGEPEEPAGSVQIRQAAPVATAPGAARIKDLAPPSAAAQRLGASPPRKVVAPKAARASHVNPTARRYPFEPSITTARPAAPRAAAPAAAHPSVVQPVEHRSPQRSPFVNDEADRDESDEEDSAPAMFEEQSDSVEVAQAEPVAAAVDCPAATEAEVRSFGETIDATTKRRPIGNLRADMQMRLAVEHSSLMDDTDRAAVRERGRCAAERDRQIVRQYYAQKYGPGYDRSSGAWWSDESLAPEFPFCYHPLYFEDPNLERCGYSQGCCCQPLLSGFQFYGNVALLPFKMLVLHPCSYVYPQCDCEPCTRYSCLDNMLGPCPESLFSSPCYSNRRCR